MNKKIAYFGAGGTGAYAYNTLKARGVLPDFFVDNDKQKIGMKYLGVPVVSVEKLKEIGLNTRIIITSFFYKELIQQLRTEGFTDIWLAIINLPPDVDKNRSEIAELRKILEDDKSAEVLDLLLNTNYGININYFNNNNESNMYFDESIFVLNDHETYADCGGFIGDTVAEFIRRVPAFNEIIVFEPSVNIFKKLTVNMKKYNGEIECVNLGVYHDKATYRFHDPEDGGSRIKSVGASEINTVTMDEYCGNKPITYIKMDIEGAEAEALIGAKDILKKYKPKLAICLYHKENDIFEIPLLIKKLNPEYKIYLRIHEITTVCYAV